MVENSKNVNFLAENPNLFSFFKPEADSFINYRMLSSFLDAALLNFDIYVFDSQILVNAFLYFLLSSNFQKQSKFCENNEETINFMGKNKNENFEEIFNEFLKTCMDCNIDEISTAMNLVEKFNDLPINFNVIGENYEKNTAFDFNVKISLFLILYKLIFFRKITITI